MVKAFLFLIYLGGVDRTYTLSRAGGNGRAFSLFAAFVWPMRIGVWICKIVWRSE